MLFNNTEFLNECHMCEGYRCSTNGTWPLRMMNYNSIQLIRQQKLKYEGLL